MFEVFRIFHLKLIRDKRPPALGHKTCDFLAAERLRLVRFVNRLIIDSFQNAVNILKR